MSPFYKLSIYLGCFKIWIVPEKQKQNFRKNIKCIAKQFSVQFPTYETRLSRCCKSILFNRWPTSPVCRFPMISGCRDQHYKTFCHNLPPRYCGISKGYLHFGGQRYMIWGTNLQTKTHFNLNKFTTAACVTKPSVSKALACYTSQSCLSVGLEWQKCFLVWKSGVSWRARWTGPDGVALHPLLAVAQPLEVEQGSPDPVQGLHFSGWSKEPRTSRCCPSLRVRVQPRKENVQCKFMIRWNGVLWLFGR